MSLYSCVASATHEKNIKKSNIVKYTKTINVKYQLQLAIINWSYPIYHILHQTFKIILSILSNMNH